MTDKIGALRYWCTKVIPLIYDDSLSYYEVLCKVTEKLNEVIEVANAGGWTQEEIEQFVSESVDAYLAELDLPTSAQIEQLQEDVGTAQEDIAELADSKMNKLPQDQTNGAIVVVDGQDVSSGEITLTEIQEAITAADTKATNAGLAAGTAGDNASAALTATGTLDANKANKVGSYTAQGKIIVTGANDKTLVQSDKGVDDFVEKRNVIDNARKVYANYNGVDETINVGTAATGGHIAQRKTNGNLTTGTPQASDECVPKSYADAITKIPLVDFNGSSLAGATSTALYNAFQTFGCCLIRNADALADSTPEEYEAIPQLVVAKEYSAVDNYFAFNVLLNINDAIEHSIEHRVAQNGIITQMV